MWNPNSDKDIKMPEYSLRERCKINTNIDADTFVGIICDKGEFSVHFPLGFDVADDEKGLRKDILLMLNTISATIGRKDSQVAGKSRSFEEGGFPFQSYLFLISDYIERGYYKEKETRYTVSTKGKINWSRTIKTQKPFIQGNEAYYLKFVTRRNPLSENELITLIHEYCVYDSFKKAGWLFTDFIPEQPYIKYNKKMFRSVVLEKAKATFNDKNKQLFSHMLAVIDEMQDPNVEMSFKYGTYRFEYVWEALIDSVYGIPDKSVYFPKTTWKVGNKQYSNANLEPDSIMLWNGNIYVLDAKYYKYGASKKLSDLPESTSINKQITYGEYIAKNKKFKALHGDDFIVYNAFLMPFNASQWEDQNGIYHIGEALSNWKSNGRPYERIQGILLDIKQLMEKRFRSDSIEIEKLSKSISEGLEKQTI